MPAEVGEAVLQPFQRPHRHAPIVHMFERRCNRTRRLFPSRCVYERLVRYAISAPNVGRPTELVALAKAAEDGGWDGFFLWDHLHFVRAMQLDIVDPWVTLGAIAHATSRLRIGAMVTPLPRRRPWKLAKEIVTLDHLSAGRVIVGVGLGFPPDDEFAAFGEPSDNASRAALLDEGLVVLEGCLRGGGFRHQGPAYNVDVDLHPAPIQRPRPPIWAAAMLPNRRPIARAQRCDGLFPIAATVTCSNPLTSPSLLPSSMSNRDSTSSRPGPKGFQQRNTRPPAPRGWSTRDGRRADGSTNSPRPPHAALRDDADQVGR